MTITTTVTTRNNQMVRASLAHGRLADQIILPMPPALTDLAAGQDTRFEMEIYARFMRHLRDVPNSRAEIKILASIQFTADMMDIGEELVAKILVDLGLRAPRRAFPCGFLDFFDKCMLRRSWGLQDVNGDLSGPPAAVLALKDHWDVIGEARFGSLPIQYAVFNEGLFVNR